MASEQARTLSKQQEAWSQVLDRKMQMLRMYSSKTRKPLMLRLDMSFAVQEKALRPDQGIAGSVFQMQELVNIPNCQQDGRFDRTIDRTTGYFTRSMIVGRGPVSMYAAFQVPILDVEGQSCGVLQVGTEL